MTDSTPLIWRRTHDDGSLGFVEQSPGGPFVALYFRPGDADRGALRQEVAFTLEDACAASDAEAERLGHRCGERCDAWTSEGEHGGRP